MSRLKLAWKKMTIFPLIRCRVDSNCNDDEYFFFHAAACYSVEGTLVFEQVRRRRLRCDARPTWWILITQRTHPTRGWRWEGNSKYSSSPVPRIPIFTSCGRGSASVEYLSFVRDIFLPGCVYSSSFSTSFDTTPWRTYLSRSHLTGRGKHTKTFRLYSA